MNRVLSGRKYVVGAVIVIIALIFLIKLFFIQVLDNKFKVSADNNSQRHVVQYPARGLIYDRNSNLLVYNQAAYDLMIVPREVSAFDTLDFCNILSIPKAELIRNITKAKSYSYYKPSILIKQISPKTYAVLQEKLFKFNGFYVQARTLRTYPRKNGANVLGYVGEVNERLISSDEYYSSGDYAGISGIERTYEKELRGEKGVKIYLVDVHNRIQGSYKNGNYDKRVVSGKDIEISLDIELQQYGELLMQNKIGSITAIEPLTGEILCLVSSPCYDPNLLVGRIRSENYKILSSDSLKPLFNRALMAQYSPGSTFKPLTALIGLDEKVINRNTSFSCAGISAKPIRCSHDHASPLNLVHSIEQSCNPYYWQTFRSIIDKPKFGSVENGFLAWRNHVFSFGFGTRFVTDLFNELRGNIPEVSYYDKYFGKGVWRAMTIRSLSIGQGEILVTPLQLANYTAIIATRGKYIKPHIIKRIEDRELPEFTTQSFNTTIDSVFFGVVIDGMHEVFEGEHGTARWYKNDSIPMCGKTGTVENPHGDNHSVFIAFAPKDNPTIAIAVVIQDCQGLLKKFLCLSL